MKARELFTIHDLIASNCKIEKLPSGLYRHSFTPATTDTVYEFEANATPVIQEGARYSIGYTATKAGRNVIDLSALSPSGQTNPEFSLALSKKISQEIYLIEKAKNDQRVSHHATDGYYWGKKYAWRMFGLVISKDAFFQYLDEIGHPNVPCITRNPDLLYGNEESTAYKQDGLENAMANLITSAEKVGRYYKSPLYSRNFAIRGINAITDKK